MPDPTQRIPAYELIPEGLERDVFDGHEHIQVHEPFYPILNIDEVGWNESTDQRLRSELSPEVRDGLRPEEKVVHIRRREVIFPDAAISPEEALRRAAKAPRAEEIGIHGTTVASVSLDDEPSKFEDPHGRDALIAADDLVSIYPALADATNIALAALQGVSDEPFVQGQPYGFEKPGGIILVNKDPSDLIGQKFTNRHLWRYPNYASADAPGRSLDLMAKCYQKDHSYLLRHRYNSRAGYTTTLSEAFLLSTQWLMDRVYESNEGLVEYANPVKGGGGMRNQGWRDSADAMVHADGTWANSDSGIVSTEVLAVSFEGLSKAANVTRDFFHDDKKAAELEAMARNIQLFILNNAWVNDPSGGYFALGFDRDEQGRLRRLEVKTPMPDLLTTGILKTDDPGVQEMVFEYIESILAPDVLTRWGIMSMSSNTVAHGPSRYHRGQIWGHIHDAFAAGASNHGFHEVDRLLGGITTETYDIFKCFPETWLGKNGDRPEVSTNDTYVYNVDKDEVYLVELVPPLLQTWAVTGEIAKHHRHKSTPPNATDALTRHREIKMTRAIKERLS